MSSITRKNKRRVAFKCAKQGIAPAQAIAVSAAREIKATKEATAETMEVLLQAIALVAATIMASSTLRIPAWMCWPNNYTNAAFKLRSTN